MKSDSQDSRWVWVDLEMTGLDPQTCHIIEIATIVTDGEFNELGQCECVIWQPESVLESMSPFVRQMHTSNGLLEKVRASEHTVQDAERMTMELLTEHMPMRTGVLAGNSIWQDRRFLTRYMPLMESYLHYRQIDVSSFKVVMQQWRGKEGLAPGKASDHTALSDIRASIEELKWYREHCLKDC